MCRLSLTTCFLFPRRHHVYVYVYTSFSSHWSVDVNERHVSIIVILYKLNELTLHYYLYIWANYYNPHACNVNSLLGSFRMISLLRNQSPWKSILKYSSRFSHVWEFPWNKWTSSYWPKNAMRCGYDWNWRCGLSPLIIDSYLSILENIIIRGSTTATQALSWAWG
jgi:hypothetical protein